MYNKRTLRVAKLFAMLTAFIFLISLPRFNSCAQVDVSQAAAPAPPAANGDIKQTLPKQGNVTVNFKDVDIVTVLHYLSEVSGVDIIPSPGVEGKITMRLRDKPWEVALDIVTRNYGYVYSREGEIIRVIPKGQLNAEEPVTEVVPLNHIIRDIVLVKGEGDASDEVAVEERQETLDQLMTAVNSILDVKRGEKATYIQSVNAIVITAIPARISDIKTMIAKLDKKSPQILLDAKVIEITLTKDERLGIDWNAVISAAGAARPTTLPFESSGVLGFLPAEQRKYYPDTGIQYVGAAGYTLTNETFFPYMDGNIFLDPTQYTPTATSLVTYGTLDFSTFTATLSLLDQRGDTEILSCPRVTTLNNQKATIKVVEKIMLQKTQETTQTAGIVTVEFESEDEAREVGVKLTIMPHVNADGDITVNLMPEVSTRAGTGFETVQVGANLNAIALTFSSREANTRVRVRDGDTIFIGGLIRTNVTKTDNRFPLLGDLFAGIPIIGNVFRYEADNVSKTEVVFFVTVHILKDGRQSLDASRTYHLYEQYNDMDVLGEREKYNEEMRKKKEKEEKEEKADEKKRQRELEKKGRQAKKQAYLEQKNIERQQRLDEKNRQRQLGEKEQEARRQVYLEQQSIERQQKLAGERSAPRVTMGTVPATTTQERTIVHTVSSAAEENKEHKPFLDFRDKQ